MNGDRASDNETVRVLANVQNRFNEFVGKVAQDLCDTFEQLELDIILTGREHQQMENEGYFHPDTEPEDTRKHACSVIANRLFK